MIFIDIYVYIAGDWEVVCVCVYCDKNADGVENAKDFAM